MRKWWADSKIFESNRPCLPIARHKLSQTTQTINNLTALTGTAYRLAISMSASYAGSLMCLRIVMTNEEYVVPNPHICFDSFVITDFNN